MPDGVAAKRWRVRALRAGAVLVVACVAGCATVAPLDTLAPVAGSLPGTLQSYLPASALPDALALLPPPPAPGSAAMALDEELFERTQRLRDTPRWALATADASLTFPDAAGTYSCALQAPVTEAETPNLYRLLRRTIGDGAIAVAPAKRHYQRVRPFLVHHVSTCTPDGDKGMRNSGSYPSSHATIGWTWALLLAELDPAHADAILARGQVYVQSRVVCAAHWASDAAEGRVMGAAVVARLHAEPLVRAQMAAAKRELDAAHAQRLPPTRDCAAEAAAIALLPPFVP